jgi:hypothetical protein
MKKRLGEEARRRGQEKRRSIHAAPTKNSIPEIAGLSANTLFKTIPDRDSSYPLNASANRLACGVGRMIRWNNKVVIPRRCQRG